MWTLVARLVALALGRVAGSSAGRVIGIGVAGDVTLDWLRQRALELAPGSDAAALEEAARSTYRMLGLDNDEVLWPRKRDGNSITPRYFVLDIGRGRAWFSQKYYSRKSVNAGFRRGRARGFRRRYA